MPNNKRVWMVSSGFLVTLVLSAVAGAAAPKPDYLWWKFDEGSGAVAKDSSGNGRDGTIANATWVTPGAGNLGACLNFTGGSATVTNAAAGTGLNGKSAVTISMWIKSRQTNTDRGFLICETPAGNDNQCTMRYDAAGANGGGVQVLKIGLTSTSGLQQLETSNNLQGTNWQHVCLTWQGGVGLKFYNNGKLDTPSNVQAVNTGTISGNTTLIIGQGGKDNSGGAGGWDGYIDDVRIYTYALTADQVAGLLSFSSADAASAPSPKDQATDVLRTTALSWTPADTAQTHTVYLGTTFADVNTATVAKPLNVLVSAGQTDTTYTPAAALQYGTTYYWRVDETSSTGTVTKGDVWSFTVEPYAYPITKVTATASSAAPGMDAQNTVNGAGLTGDLHGTDGTTMWMSTGAAPNWIQYQFDKVYKLYDLKVWNSNQTLESFIGFGAKDVKVEYSTDGATWTTLANVPPFAQAPGAVGYAANTTVSFGGVMAQYVKLTINSNWGGVSPAVGLSEVRFSYVPVQAWTPQPATGAANVAVDATLTWRPGREAASHQVFLGTDPNGVAQATVATQTVSGTSFSPAALAYGTTYYWRVDEVNKATYPGDVWSFTTVAYAVVEDFESYSDQPGSAMFETWVDGYDNPAANGATVGNTDPTKSIAETTIIHGGKQSMPLFYDNTKAPRSEATRTFAPAQDWTARGLKSLSLWFQGVAGNTGQLYVKINGTKVAYDGPATDLAKSAWTPWNINLSTVSGLSKVSSLTIGIEGSGSKGTLYVDDVRLYPLTPQYITPVDPGKTNLLAQYALDGDAKDSSGHNLNGTAKQGTFVASSRTGGGQALQLQKAGYVDLGNPASLDFATGDWALTGWYKNAMKGTGDANKGTLVSKGGDNTGGKRYGLIMSETTEGVVTMVTDDDVTKYVVDSKSKTNDDQWHFVVGQRTGGTTLQIWIDGSLEKSLTIPAAYNLSGTSQHDAYLGAMTNHTDGSLYKLYNGLIDEVHIYNRALTQGEILFLLGQTTPAAQPF